MKNCLYILLMGALLINMASARILLTDCDDEGECTCCDVYGIRHVANATTGCAGYQQLQATSTITLECPKNTLFDVRSCECSWAESVDCQCQPDAGSGDGQDRDGSGGGELPTGDSDRI